MKFRFVNLTATLVLLLVMLVSGCGGGSNVSNSPDNGLPTNTIVSLYDFIKPQDGEVLIYKGSMGDDPNKYTLITFKVQNSKVLEYEYVINDTSTGSTTLLSNAEYYVEDGKFVRKKQYIDIQGYEFMKFPNTFKKDDICDFEDTFGNDAANIDKYRITSICLSNIFPMIDDKKAIAAFSMKYNLDTKQQYYWIAKGFGLSQIVVTTDDKGQVAKSGSILIYRKSDGYGQKPTWFDNIILEQG